MTAPEDPPRTDDLHSLAAAYALDALDPDERRAFEAHWPDCATCALEVPGYRAAAGQLAGGAATPAPAGLRDAVLAEVARTRQLPPLVPSTPDDRTGGDRTRPDEGAAVVDLSARRRAPGTIARALLVAAVVLLVAAVGGLLVARAGGDAVTDELAQVVAAPDAVTVDLDGDGPGTVRVLVSRQVGAAVLVGSGLPEPADGRTYQLWSIGPDGPASAGTFRPDGDGTVGATVPVPAPDATTWGVTEEPGGGSPQPTGSILYASA